MVSDRYQNYFHPRWEHIAGNQACLSTCCGTIEDCAESYPGAVWPVQAHGRCAASSVPGTPPASRDLPAIPAEVREPLEHEFRHAVTVGLASVPRVPGPKNQHEAEARPRAARILPRPPQADVLRFTDGHQRLADERSGFTLHLLGALRSIRRGWLAGLAG